MSRNAGSPRYFTDRNLGAIKVPGLLRAAGLHVVTLQERYGPRRAQSVTDEEWLRDAGREGDLVLMRDTRIHRNPVERAALVTYGVRAFCLARGDTTGEEQAALFLRHIERITAIGLAEPGPLLYVISGEGIRRKI